MSKNTDEKTIILKLSKKDKDIIEWFENQRNKAWSVRKLVRDCISVHGFQDLDSLPIIADYLRTGNLSGTSTAGQKRRPGRPRKEQAMPVQTIQETTVPVQQQTTQPVTQQPVQQQPVIVEEQVQTVPAQTVTAEQPITQQSVQQPAVQQPSTGTVGNSILSDIRPKYDINTDFKGPYANNNIEDKLAEKQKDNMDGVTDATLKDLMNMFNGN